MASDLIVSIGSELVGLSFVKSGEVARKGLTIVVNGTVVDGLRKRFEALIRRNEVVPMTIIDVGVLVLEVIPQDLTSGTLLLVCG